MNDLLNKMVNEDKYSFYDLYNYLQENDIGTWDNVNDEDTIRDYCKDMIGKGINISHILEVLENNKSINELYSIWLGNSMNTPTPINTKQDLLDALEITL